MSFDSVSLFVVFCVCLKSINGIGFGDSDFFNGPIYSFFNRQNQAIRDAISKQTWTPCVTSGEERLQGSCLTNQDCFLRGGKLHFSGNCGLLETCCTEQRSTCSSTSYTKISYFSNPSDNYLPSRCEHNIRFISRSVCQVRLDFEQFAIANPENDVTNVQTYGKCLNDSFSASPSSNDVPEICGQNSGQHIYLHVNGEQIDTLQLRFILANRTLFPQLTSPNWRIKITQLECPILINRRFTTRSILDNSLTAPYDCLQYFNESTGTFSSFNFQNQGPYQQQADYSICIEKPPGACGIVYNFNSFIVGSNTTATVSNAIDQCQQDYLVLQPAVGPLINSTNTPTFRQTSFCNNIAPVSLTRYSPGPFYSMFHSAPQQTQGQNNNAFLKQGFRISYRILQSC